MVIFLILKKLLTWWDLVYGVPMNIEVEKAVENLNASWILCP